MSLAENRHHRWRIVNLRRSRLKNWWKDTATHHPEWLEHNARMKTNPFTLCSCYMCQENNRQKNKRARAKAKLEIKREME